MRPGCKTAARVRLGGFSLIELMIVMGVVLVGALLLSQSLATSMRLTEVNRETALATDGVREMVERLQGDGDFKSLFRRYNADALDDPSGEGTAPGNAFAVEGLQAVDDDPDGMVGEIVFPIEIGAGGKLFLFEDHVDESLGMPRDLNGDGDIDAIDHSGDYRVLPVAVRLRWKGMSGERTTEIRTLLADR
jgi:prepilin-type N-terminal cleavage/methylation domain-containing protein